MKLRHSGLVLAGVVLVLSTVACGSTPPATVLAKDDGPGRIQDAIDGIDPGGIIVIRSGTYKENLLIDRPLTLIGEDGVTVEPEDPSQPAIIVRETGAVSIQGLTIRDAVVGIELISSSCSIVDCLIRASGTGVRSVAFEGTTVLIDHVEFRGDGTGTGVAILGRGFTLLADCQFDLLGTGASLGGAASTVVRGCSFGRCFDGIAVMNSVPAVLIGNVIRGNYGNGINLSQNPALVPDEALVLVGNTIEENGHWGISLCGFDAIEPAIRFGRIEGADNAFRGNGQGRTCPEDLTLPSGFFLEE